MQYDQETLFFNRNLSFKHALSFANKENTKKDGFDLTLISSEILSSDQNQSSSQESTSESSENILVSSKVLSHAKNNKSTKKVLTDISTKTTYKNTKKKAANKTHLTPSSESSFSLKRDNSLTPPPRLPKQVIQEGRRIYMRLTQKTKVNQRLIKKINCPLEKENDLYLYNNTNIETYNQQKSSKGCNTLTIFEITIVGKRNTKTDAPNFFPETWEEPILFKISENQAFKTIKNAFCSHKKLSKSYYNQIVLVFRKKRVFESATPKGIGMLKYDSRIEIEIMSKAAYEHLINEIKEKKKINNRTYNFFDLTEKTPESTPYIIIDESPIELVLRNKNNENLKLSVDSNTTISKLIDIFKASKNIDTNTHITLEFEGEHLKPNLSISNYDIENGDLIDVQINN
ncbi:unnamed protein product [Pneumocystis jirovecii]|uniref:Ubiquitin-like domain-containing protein n=1 Tax=Pneumocystis jirovecii TaxID=42068 RepID=L0PAR3_PNEJI|nr:unnamed protein product [Pneumocystis jirovecii]